MHEKILELADRAFMENRERLGIINVPDQFCIHFAQLIASECAELCDRFQERNMQSAECAGAIRKMFGVEE